MRAPELTSGRTQLRRVTLLLTAIFFVYSGSAAWAESQANLKDIMIELGADMERIVRALNYGDFKAIEERAREIAYHDKPQPTEMARVLAFLGDEAKAFKSLDALVHNQGLKVAEAALMRDPIKVVEAYKLLLGGCVVCHEKFRAGLSEELKGFRESARGTEGDAP